MRTKHKIVQVKQWLKEKNYKANKFIFIVHLGVFAATIRDLAWVLEKFFWLCGFIISIFIGIAPILKAIFKFLETLASSLSYMNKKEFFYGF